MSNSAGTREIAERTKTAERISSIASRPVGRDGRDRGPEAEAKPEAPPKGWAREYFESAVVTVIMALFGMTFIVQAVKVPTGSMQNTITIGDHLLVNKFIFAPGPRLPFLPQREIRRGDIIVFKYPGNKFNPEGDKREDNTPFKVNYVKRVIGLPGDSVEVRGLHVYINGELLPEHLIAAESNDEKAPLEIKEKAEPKPGERYDVYYRPETVAAARRGQEPGSSSEFHFAVNGVTAKVPADSYFVMGDNRENSEDSRAWGFVQRDLIIGRAMFVYWSYDESAPSSSNFLIDFFVNTRWRRTGTMVK
jgi:signal peptidase I